MVYIDMKEETTKYMLNLPTVLYQVLKEINNHSDMSIKDLIVHICPDGLIDLVEKQFDAGGNFTNPITGEKGPTLFNQDRQEYIKSILKSFKESQIPKNRPSTSGRFNTVVRYLKDNNKINDAVLEDMIKATFPSASLLHTYFNACKMLAAERNQEIDLQIFQDVKNNMEETEI